MLKKKILWSQSIKGRVEAGHAGFLERTSIEARTVDSVAALVESAVEDPPDLIALDFDSAELPALSVCRRLQADERTRDIRTLVVAPSGAQAEALRAAGCSEILEPGIEPQEFQGRLARALGMRLRRHPRFPVVLPVARGRIFHEFLGYSTELSEGGMGFETIIRLRGGDHVPLRIYRNTEEKPIFVLGRVCSVRPGPEDGLGYAVGVEFFRLEMEDRRRLLELFPEDTCVTWSYEGPGERDKPDLSDGLPRA